MIKWHCKSRVFVMRFKFTHLLNEMLDDINDIKSKQLVIVFISFSLQIPANLSRLIYLAAAIHSYPLMLIDVTLIGDQTARVWL